MPKITEDVKNELTGLQYLIDQIQLNKINIDFLFSSNKSNTKDHNDVSESDEIDEFLSRVEEIKKLDERINDHLNDYLECFPPNQQSDFHYMLDALQNFVEWTDDYSKRIKSFETGNVSEKQLEEFRMSSEFVSLCCNWLSSTVSTVLKYGFGGSESESV